MQEQTISSIEIKDSGVFYRLEEGNNVCRIVSGFVSRIATFKDGSQAQKWCCWVIDRKDGEVRLAEFGMSIIKQIKALSENPEYTFEMVPSYDITIFRDGKGMETRYTITPARKDTELTEEEKRKIEKAGKVADFVMKLKAPSVTAEPNENTESLRSGDLSF